MQKQILQDSSSLHSCLSLSTSNGDGETSSCAEDMYDTKKNEKSITKIRSHVKAPSANDNDSNPFRNSHKFSNINNNNVINLANHEETDGDDNLKKNPSTIPLLSSQRSNSFKSSQSNTIMMTAEATKKIFKVKPRNEFLPRNNTSFREKLIHFLIICILCIITFVISFGEFVLLPKDEVDWCKYAKKQLLLNAPTRKQYKKRRQLLNSSPSSSPSSTSTPPSKSFKLTQPYPKHYDNPDYDANPCRLEHSPYLLFISISECDFARRMLCSVFLGAAIGFERKSADRPAGIRTMSLVSLGSCFFTICSMVGFRYSTTMGWDAARVSAAIPSGVGFLGAGLIWKGTLHKGTDRERQEVHGLTTAACVWLSAAVGVGTGGKLYVISVYTTALVIFVLRLGPKLYLYSSSDQSCSSNIVENNYDMEGWDSRSENDTPTTVLDKEAVSEVEYQSRSRKEGSEEFSIETGMKKSFSFDAKDVRSNDTHCMNGDDEGKDGALRRCVSNLATIHSEGCTNQCSSNRVGDEDNNTIKTRTRANTLRRIKSDAALLVPIRDNYKSKRKMNHRNQSFFEGPTFFY